MDIKKVIEKLYMQRNELYLKIDFLEKELYYYKHSTLIFLKSSHTHLQSKIEDTYNDISKINKSIEDLESKK
ncbi:hypothetical protein ACBT_1226 [Aliarcobacter cibarius]|uniref:Uncharacterized protein n=1 Tax=Aliarcobacter cibarius TaxID=255507 RepID=A0A7L5JPL2_9BACT|nr:hypothetical protein [Aliarcobacter cibarius]QKJ27135.1 hypothetical protein ACBT_1226 [Aliarcobacter cibarius]